jgi:hypothetical protein
MFNIGQEVMVIGDSRCPIGMVSTIALVMPCDMGDRGIQYIYGLAARPTLADGSLEVYFQEQHLMPLDDFETTIGGLIDLDLPVDMIAG